MTGWSITIGGNTVSGYIEEIEEELNGHEEAIVVIPNTSTNRGYIASDATCVISYGSTTLFTGILTGADYSQDFLKCKVYNQCFEILKRKIITHTYVDTAANTILSDICTAAGITLGGTPPTDLLSLDFNKAYCFSAVVEVAKATAKDYYSSGTTLYVQARGSSKGTITGIAYSSRGIDRSKQRDKVYVRGIDAYGVDILGEAGTGSEIYVSFDRNAKDVATLNKIAADILSQLNIAASGVSLTVSIANGYQLYPGDTIYLNQDDRLKITAGTYRILKTIKKIAEVSIQIDRPELTLEKYLADLDRYDMFSISVPSPAIEPARTDDLVSNGSFEGDDNNDGIPDDWEYRQFGSGSSVYQMYSTLTDYIAAGKYSLKITDDAGERGGIVSNWFPVEAGKVYIVSAYGRVVDTSDSIEVCLATYDNAKSTEVITIADTGNNGSNMERIIGTVTIGAGKFWGRVIVRKSNTDSNSIYIDQVSCLIQRTGEFLSKGIQPFNSNITFEPYTGDEHDSIQWGAGTVQFTDGTTLAINAGNFQNLTTGTHFIYFTAGSSDLLQSTSFNDAVGEIVGLLSIVEVSSSASQQILIQPFYSKGLNINADVIAANSIFTDALQASAVTAGKVSVLGLDSNGKLVLGQIGSGNLDNILDGTSYEKVIATEVDAGYIKLTTSQNMGAQGLSIVSNTPGNPRVEITSSLIAGYNGSDVLMFKIKASDGKAYFAGESGVLDNNGIGITGQYFLMKTAGGNYVSPIFISSGSPEATTVYAPGDRDLVLKTVRTGDGDQTFSFDTSDNIINSMFAIYPASSSLDLGSVAFPWGEIHSIDIYGDVRYKDMYFGDLECPRCKEKFKIGERISLQVMGFDEKKGEVYIRALPAHYRCPIVKRIKRWIKCHSHGNRQ